MIEGDGERVHEASSLAVRRMPTLTDDEERAEREGDLEVLVERVVDGERRRLGDAPEGCPRT